MVERQAERRKHIGEFLKQFRHGAFHRFPRVCLADNLDKLASQPEKYLAFHIAGNILRAASTNQRLLPLPFGRYLAYLTPAGDRSKFSRFEVKQNSTEPTYE